VGSVYGLTAGRHTRINTPNIKPNDGTFPGCTSAACREARTPGELVYRCANDGSCIGPDTCTCTDGYQGFDCKTPLCRHLQPTGTVSSCLNGGVCVSKDSCNCVQTGSVLWQVGGRTHIHSLTHIYIYSHMHSHAYTQTHTYTHTYALIHTHTHIHTHPTHIHTHILQVHTDTSRGLTGWTGTDCSMPICIQGYYDPFCTDLPQAPGGEGCFRCANKGNCTAPGASLIIFLIIPSQTPYIPGYSVPNTLYS
jgi:hypothetical protein